MVAAQRVIRRDLDEDEDEAVGIRGAELDESPGLAHGRLHDPYVGCGEASLERGDVAHLEPELGGRSRGGVAGPRQLEEASAQEEDDAAAGAGAELAPSVSR